MKIIDTTYTFIFYFNPTGTFSYFYFYSLLLPDAGLQMSREPENKKILALNRTSALYYVSL